MRAGLVFAAALALGGCSFKLDILGDSEPDRCPGTDLDYCVPPGVSIRVADAYADLAAGSDITMARGGLVALIVDDGAADREDELSVEVDGCELVSQEDRRLVVRPIEEAATVHVEVGGLDDDILLTSLPVDEVAIVPVEEQFQAAPGPLAIAGGAQVPAVVHLLAGETRLLDVSLTATGAAVTDQSRWDFVDIDAAVQPTVFTLHAESFAMDVVIPKAGALDSVEIVTGPGLSDPRETIRLDADGDATVCFTGVAGGREVAGLEWIIEGGANSSGGCAFVDRTWTTLTVSAGGITRTFDLDIIDP